MDEVTPRLINRELSWLAFNRRVLAEAQDPGNPLLERLKFLAITGSNLDEFFMVRVGGLQQVRDEGVRKRDPSGMTPEEQLAAISRDAHALVDEQYRCLADLEPRLAAQGIRRLAPEQLSPAQLAFVQQVFDREIFPLITPRAVPSAAAFPQVSGLAVCVGVRLARPADKDTNKYRLAVVPLPPNLPRMLTLTAEGGHAYVMMEDIVRAFLDRFFPGEHVAESFVFRITRNADLAVQEDMAGDLLEQMRRVLDQRRDSACVRLEVTTALSDRMRSFLKRALKVTDADYYEMPGPLGLTAYFGLSLTPGAETLKNPPWPPQAPAGVKPSESMFAAIARGDVMLHHPFESFDPVVRLIEEAAADPDVLAIKQTLYRTSRDSPILTALARAAAAGKSVTVVVELKARFDEARNIEWARSLERHGVQVIYGVKGLKTHAKLCLIVRREASGIRRYVHVGTGNYNEITARLYTDVSYLTCHEDYGADASVFFNTITGYSQPVRYRRIEAAPTGLRERVLELIEGETLRAGQGRKARLMAKLNSLEDPEIIEALYRASKAGVSVRLNVRGLCCLRAGVPGLSENISVVSVVDRFLEHSRILYVEQGGEPMVFISSADWMPRNLDRRIELLVPIQAEVCRDRLIGILETCLGDTVKGWQLKPDNGYERPAVSGKRARRSQELLYREACARLEQERLNQTQVFEPHRPGGTSPAAG